MIAIYANGKKLKLGESPSLAVVLNSGFFSEDIISDFIWPLNLPPVRENFEALGYGDEYEVDFRSSEISANLEVHGLTHPCKLKIRNFDKGIRIDLKLNLGALTCLKKPLNEIPIPTDLDNDFDWYNKGTNNVWPDTNYYLPEIWNPYFYDDPSTSSSEKFNPNYLGLINQCYPLGNSWLINHEVGSQTYNRNVFCPQVPVLEVIQRALMLDGIKLMGSFMKDEMARRLFVYNNRASHKVKDADAGKWTSAQANQYTHNYNVGAIPITSSSNSGVVDASTDEFIAWSAGTYRFEITLYISSLVGVDEPYLRVDTNFGIDIWYTQYFGGYNPAAGTYKFDFQLTFASGDVNKRFKFRLVDDDGTGTSKVTAFFVIQKVISGGPATQMNPVDDLRKFLPNITFGTFIKHIKDVFNLQTTLDLNTGTFTLSYKDEVLTQPPMVINGVVKEKPKVELLDDKPVRLRYKRDAIQNEEEEKDDLVFNQVIELTAETSTAFEKEEEGFDGKYVEFEAAPLVPRPFSFTDPSGFLVSSASGSTLAAFDRGIDELLGLEGAQAPLRLGVYLGKMNDRPSAGLGFGSRTLQLTLDPESIVALWSDWIQYQLRDPRRFIFQVTINRADINNLSIDRVIQFSRYRLVPDTAEFNLGDGRKIELLISGKKY